MRIIILAAGKGERLMPLTKNTPKPLLDMGNGNTLLEEQLASIRESGALSEILLVVGYLADQVEAKLRFHTANGLNVRTVYNPFYDVSNNLMSLWLAKHSMLDSDFMITNGDNLFTPDVFSDLAADTGEGIFLSVSPKQKFDYDDMKVTLRDGLVSRVSKQVPDEDAQAESPGLALVRGPRARSLFAEHLELLARDRGYVNRFWLEVFNLLYERGVSVRPWSFDASTRWQEIDFHLDVNKMRNLVAKRIGAPVPA